MLGEAAKTREKEEEEEEEEEGRGEKLPQIFPVLCHLREVARGSSEARRKMSK